MLASRIFFSVAMIVYVVSVVGASVATAADNPSADGFVEAESLTVETKTIYQVTLHGEHGPVVLALDLDQYRLLMSLVKLPLHQVMPLQGMSDQTKGTIHSINKSAVEAFGKPVIVESGNGFSLHHKASPAAQMLFSVTARGVFYRGQEIILTDKQHQFLRTIIESRTQPTDPEEVARAMGWNGRQYRTNIRSYTDNINMRTASAVGANLIEIGSRGSTIRVAPVEPSVHTKKDYVRVNGRIVLLEGAALEIAEGLTDEIRLRLSSTLVYVPKELYLKANLLPRDFIAAVKEVYNAVNVESNMLSVVIGTVARELYRFDNDGNLLKGQNNSCRGGFGGNMGGAQPL